MYMYIIILKQKTAKLLFRMTASLLQIYIYLKFQISFRVKESLIHTIFNNDDFNIHQIR